MSHCLYTSFFTPDYIEPATNLIQSLYLMGLDYEVSKAPDSGFWIENCARKPKFIFDMLQKFPDRYVVWTDADSLVVKRPALFEDVPVVEKNILWGQDAAVCEYMWRNGKRETFSGTIWFAPTEGAKRLADIWLTLQLVHKDHMDQKVLAKAVDFARAEGVKIATLPVEYCFIFDMHRTWHLDAKPVIEHYQYSRVRKDRERREQT